MYCSLHRPATRLVRSCGVLLCHPLGHEYFRSYRSYVRLAGRLAEYGFPVLRFDWIGTGDSEGNAPRPELAAWLDDIDVAAAELRRSEPVSRLVVGGLRFGATLALLAAARRDDVHAVLLWEPVLEPAAYVEQLRRLHRAMLHDLERFPRPRRGGDAGELVGQVYGETLLHDIAALDATCLRLPQDVAHALLACTRDAPLEPGGRVLRLPLDAGYGWSDARRIEESIVDPAAVARLADGVNRVAA